MGILVKEVKGFEEVKEFKKEEVIKMGKKMNIQDRLFAIESSLAPIKGEVLVCDFGFKNTPEIDKQKPARIDLLELQKRIEKRAEMDKAVITKPVRSEFNSQVVDLGIDFSKFGIV